MATSKVINVNDVIDARRFQPFDLAILILCFFILLCDGFDLTVISFAVPSLAKEWHIQNMSALGPVFAASSFGLFIGAPIAGYIADRIGRRTTIICAAFLFSIFVLATAWAESVTQLIALRFLSGLGMGGVIPIGIVMSGEFAPKARRAVMMSVATTGITIGTGLPGLAAAWVLSHYGWRGLFVLGGVTPMIIACGLLVFLPESVRYLALRSDRKQELARLLRRMQPGIAVDPAADSFVFNEERRSSASVRQLFDGGYKIITPLIWFLFIAVGVVLYFIHTWTPTIFIKSGLPMTSVGFAFAIFQAGGVFGGLAMGWPVDRFGALPVAVVFALTAPVIFAIGLPGLEQPYLFAILAVAGFGMLALQLGCNALSGLVYPTYVRGSGVGWGLGMTRLGQMVSAVCGGLLLDLGLSPAQLFGILAVTLLLGAIAGYALHRKLVQHRILDPEARTGDRPIQLKEARNEA